MSTSRERNIKKALIKHSKAVKRKFLALQQGRLLSQHLLGKAFQPITTPLNALTNQMRDSNKNIKEDRPIIKHEVSTATDEYGPLADTFIDLLIKKGDTSRAFDKQYGIQYIGGKFIMGETPVTFQNDVITVGGVNYRGTKGIYTLLFHANPAPNSFDEEDLRKYKQILLTTNAHRVDCDPYAEYKYSNSNKFQNIILPLFRKRGGSWKVSLPNHKTEYKYWDDPNELVERLHLLMSSRGAGNSGLDNEIYAIEEELREGGYIE